MNDLKNEWDLSGGDSITPLKAPLQMLLNAPITGYTSPPEADGRPFVSHRFEDTPHFVRFANEKNERKNITYAEKISSITSTWGPSSPMKNDWDQLATLTENLIRSAMAFDFDGVRAAIKEGADPNTLLLIKDKSTKDQEYVPAPLGVALVLYAQTLGRDFVNKASETAELLLTKNDGTSKIQVGAYNDSMAVSYPAVGIEWGAESIVRQLPLTLAQSAALGKCVPQALDTPVKSVDEKIAYGEDLPKSSRESFCDMYDPVRDTLNKMLLQYRDNRLNPEKSSNSASLKRK